MKGAFHRRLDFSDVALYAVTPDTSHTTPLLTKLEDMLKGGVDAVQLRNRSLTDRQFMAFGKEIKARCAKYGALFIVNNRADLALALDADGIHLGHEDLPIQFVREWVGHRRIIGRSTHSLPEALEAQKLGADYVSCGPVWATPTKPDYQAVGLGLIGLYKAALRIPFVVIGGVDSENFDSVVGAGAKSVAVVRSLFDASNPTILAQQFKEKIKINRIKTVV